jgi:hypothetical protein
MAHVSKLKDPPASVRNKKMVTLDNLNLPVFHNEDEDLLGFLKTKLLAV